MSKVPCGGFKLDENFLGMNENDELSLVGGGGEFNLPYQQLVTDGDGKAAWAYMTLPVSFWATDKTSSATIGCNLKYEDLIWHLNAHNFDVMSGQLYIESSKNLFTMASCTQKDHRLEFSFIFPREASGGVVLGAILTVYYLENGTITFTRPVE